MSPTEFLQDERGSVAIIVALSLTVLLGFVALGVDVASLYRDRGALQNAADLAAISPVAASKEAKARAEATVARNARPRAEVATLELGRYLRNPAIAPEDRFTPLPSGSAGINAARVALEDDAALHFGVIFSDADHVRLNREALASRTGAASFALDTAFLGLESDSLLNTRIEAEFGAGARLSPSELASLADAQIALGSLLMSLDSAGGRNPAAVLEATVGRTALITALDGLVPEVTLSALAQGGGSVSVAELISGLDPELGLTAMDFLEVTELSARDMLAALLATEAGGVSSDLTTSIPGVASTQLTLTAGEPAAQSGRVGLGEQGVTLNRAAARMTLETEIEPTLLTNLTSGVAVTALHAPLHVEIAGATATLDTLSCRGGDNDVAASFSVTPTPLHPANGLALATLSLGDRPVGQGALGPAALGFADLLTVEIRVPVPLLPDLVLSDVTIQARSHVAVGQAATDRINFTRADIAAGDTVRSYGTQAHLTTAVEALFDPARTELRVKPGHEGLITGLAAPVVNQLMKALPGALLSALVAPLDRAVEAALAEAGLRLGEGEITLLAHHCEPLQLVQ